MAVCVPVCVCVRACVPVHTCRHKGTQTCGSVLSASKNLVCVCTLTSMTFILLPPVLCGRSVMGPHVPSLKPDSPGAI